MNLRDQLKEILPGILPKNPAQAIKGTELIELVKYQLKQNYSDATLRYHFSIMSCDPSSPIAKVEQGQGYYLRTTTIHSLHSARNLLGASQVMLGEDPKLNTDNADLSLSRANKFRAVVRRYFESIHRFPMSFERSFTDDHTGSRCWRFPDMIAVEWLVGEVTEDGGFDLLPEQMEVRRRLGESPFRIASVKLKLEVGNATIREALFQCLSASEWANCGELMVAAPIEDEQLLNEIRHLSHRYGVGLTTFGLDADVLDDLPEPAAIHNLMPREFEAIQSLFRLRRIAGPQANPRFNWQHVVEQRADHQDFAQLDSWISHCLLSERAVKEEDFRSNPAQVRRPEPGFVRSATEHVA